VSPTGEVWAITSGGVVRWDAKDGSYSEVYDDSWPDPLPETMAFTPDGDLWLGFYTDILRRDGSRWTGYQFTPAGEDWSWIHFGIDPQQVVAGTAGVAPLVPPTRPGAAAVTVPPVWVAPAVIGSQSKGAR